MTSIEIHNMLHEKKKTSMNDKALLEKYLAIKKQNEDENHNEESK